jgi:hypothetical protein
MGTPDDLGLRFIYWVSDHEITYIRATAIRARRLSSMGTIRRPNAAAYRGRRRFIRGGPLSGGNSTSDKASDQFGRCGSCSRLARRVCVA